MSNDERSFSRRRAIALLFGVGIGSYLLGSAFIGTTVAATLSIDNDSVTTDNGSISGLTLTVNSEVTWDGAETDPGDTTVELQVKHSDSWETIDTHTANLTGLAGTHTHEFNSVDILGNSSWKKNDFKASGDGSSLETNIDARLSVETSNDIDGDGSPESFTSNTDTFTVTVNNEQNNNNAGGNGQPTISGSDQSP